MAYYTHNEYQIYYEMNGTKDKTLLVLNGIMMSSASWDRFIPAWEEEFQILRFDMLDQGKSSKATTPYTQALQVEILHGLLMHLKLKNVSILGISYGTSIALRFVVQYPELVDKMVLANGGAYTSDWLKAIGEGWNEVAKTRNGEAYYNITIPYIYSPNFYNNSIEWMTERKKFLVPLFSDESFLDSMIRLTNSSFDFDVRNELGNIQNEIVLIGSTHDFLTPLEEQKYLEEHLPHATLHTIHDAGHASMYEDDQLFSKIVIEALK